MTTNQIKYLMALHNLNEQERSCAKVARMFQVNRSTVSRVLAPCVQEGILDETMKITELGSSYLREFQRKSSCIEQYLIAKGTSQEHSKEDAIHILTGCSEETRNEMVQAGSLVVMKRRLFAEWKKSERNGIDLVGCLEKGSYPVDFLFQKEKKVTSDQLSMANRAFVHPGTLVIADQSSHLCLKMKDIEQKSRLGKLKLTGKMEHMTYMVNGAEQEAVVAGDVVCLSLRAFTIFPVRESFEVYGQVRVKLSCTVGNIHMPESAAILNIRL